MRITVGTNFLISATQWDYSIAHKLLKKLIVADAKLFATKEIVKEFSEVLHRDFKYSQDEINHIIERVLSFVETIEPAQKVDVIKEDPDDNKIIECAISSNSEFIITYDKHLLKVKEYKGIQIIRPETARAIF